VTAPARRRVNGAGNPWRRTASRLVYQNPWFRVREDQVVRPDGTPGSYGVVELPEYAGVVAVDERDRVALVRQWRYLSGRDSLEVPAGNAAPADASPLAAAQRELLEEAGLTAARWMRLGRIDYSAVTNPGHLFLARELSPAAAAAANAPGEPADDWTQLVWLDYHHAIDLVATGEITESTSVAALLLAETLRVKGAWSLPSQQPPRRPVRGAE
jgi:8-oxo-dGTP pyrophosphatase MutT (NUDIX family)